MHGATIKMENLKFHLVSDALFSVNFASFFFRGGGTKDSELCSFCNDRNKQ
jgi:hypothetical protein